MSDRDDGVRQHNEPGPVPEFERLPVDCDASMLAFEDAATRLPAAAVYDLHCAAEDVAWMRILLREMACEVRGNPFAPYVNLIRDIRLRKGMWFFEVAGQRVGSAGIG